MTSAGSDRGALPIRDRHLDVLENGLAVGVAQRAGTRKSGRALLGAADAWSRRATFCGRRIMGSLVVQMGVDGREKEEKSMPSRALSGCRSE